MAKETLKDHFEESKQLETELDQGAAEENKLLRMMTQHFIKETREYEKSKEKWQKTVTKVACVISAISVLISLILAVAVALLTPLKTVEPYLLYVDRSSGHAEVRQPLSGSASSFGEATDMYFIREYVTARESYDWNLAQRHYDTVKAFSDIKDAPTTWNEYSKFMKSDKSPLQLLADNAKVDVKITSTSLDLDTSTATVRFSKTVIGKDGLPDSMIPKTFWIATLKYQYPETKLEAEERRLNPLGMKIPAYQTVQEQGRR